MTVLKVNGDVIRCCRRLEDYDQSFGSHTLIQLMGTLGGLTSHTSFRQTQDHS